jgi:O-antigen ligase
VKRYFPRPETLLGFAVPLAPAFGINALLLCVVLYLIFTAKEKNNSRGLKAGAPLLVVIALSVFIDCAAGFNLDWWSYYLSSTDHLEALFLFLGRGTSSYQIALLSLLRFSALFLLYDRFSNNKERQDCFQTGLTVGFAAAALLLALQINGLLQGVFPRQTRYWTEQGRFAGSFTDPNALGLMVFLALPLFFEKNLIKISFLFLLIWLGCYSGSRTMLLGIAVLSAVCILQEIKTEGRRIALISVLGAALSYLTLTFLPAQYLPVAVARAVETLTPGHISEALFSRTIFLKTGFSLWLEHPLVGVGFEQFRYFFPSLSLAEGVNLNLWTDNPNNFYLGILVELGIVGFIALLFTFAGFQKKEGVNLISNTIIVFLALCIFGPHLVFDEVMVLFAFLLSRSFSAKPVTIPVLFRAALIPCILLIAVKAVTRERGFYAWQQEEEGFYRWTSNSAKSFYKCQTDQPKTLLLKSEYPVSVIINSADQIELKEKEARAVLLPCHQGRKMPYTIKVLDSWTPLLKTKRRDGRLLGVKVYSADVTPPF